MNKVLNDRAQLRRVSRELAALKRQQAEAGNVGVGNTERSTRIKRLNRLLINLAPVNEVRELSPGVSQRYRENKLSRVTSCPGEGGVPLPLSSLDANQPMAATIDTQDVGKSENQQRWSGALDPPTLTGRSVTRAPLSPLISRDPATLGFMRPAQAHAQHEVADMQEKLPSLQTKRDARALVIEAENSRVR